jgi:hypothetical protein
MTVLLVERLISGLVSISRAAPDKVIRPFSRTYARSAIASAD